jgi:hypothetical protein
VAPLGSTIRRLSSLASVAALVVALAGAQAAQGDSLYPFHVSANSVGAISASGWRASVQIRPYSATPTYAWAGGYLEDGTFVQSGIVEPGPTNAGVAQAFVWAQTPAMPSPLYLTIGQFGSGAFVDFHAERVGSLWSFYLVGPDGKRADQATLASSSNLQAQIVEAEPWMSAWGTFPTQAFRGVQIRSGSTWTVPHLAFGPSEPICGEAEIVPTPGLNLVIRPTAGGSPCYVVLS